MKKIISFIFSVLLFCTILVIIKIILTENSKSMIQNSNSNILSVYNYGSYIDPELLTKFTKETGYQVNYETYDSNESMMVKLEQGGSNYDVVFPSEPFVSKLAMKKLLEPFDYSKIKGFNNLDPLLLNQKFDPHNKYSLPYFWGTTGIMFNSKVFQKSDFKTWSKLWNKKFENQIMLIDAPRESIGMALQSLGYSENDANKRHIAKAKKQLTRLGPNVKAILNDEIRSYVVSGESNVAVAYSGIADYAHAENKNIQYIVPSHGGSIWTDNISIPKSAKNKKAAYAFINFLLQPKNAAKNAEYVAYSSPNLTAKKYLPKSITSDQILYPKRSTLVNLEHYQVLSDHTTEKYNDAWLEAKLAIANK